MLLQVTRHLSLTMDIHMPRSGQHISTDTTFKGVKQFAQQAVWNLMDVHDAILEHRIGQMHYSNKCCQPGIKYQINDLLYLSTENLTLPKHRAWKLMPKFIGAYKILKAMNESSNVTLELPQEFKDRKINPTFHTNLVQPYQKRWYIVPQEGHQSILRLWERRRPRMAHWRNISP